MNPSRARILLTAAVCAALAFLFYFRPIQDDDAWLHFAAGRWILDQRAVPAVDMFSCTAPGVPYVDHEWLAQAIFETTRRAFDLTGFRALIAACAAFGFGLFAMAAMRAGAGAKAAIGAAIGCLLLQWHVARARPQVFTILCVALIYYEFIGKHDKLTFRRILWFAAICIFWANTHAACVIAPIFLALAAAGAWIAGARARAQQLIYLTIGAGVLLLINPYGYKVYSYALETQGLADLIPEWKPLTKLLFDPAELARETPGSDFRAHAAYAAAILATTAALAARRFIHIFKGGVANTTAAAAAPVALACAAMPWIANRHDLFMMIPFAFCAAELSEIARAGSARRAWVAAFGWTAAVIAIFGLFRDADYRYRNYSQFQGGAFADTWPPHEPTAAVDFIEKAGLEGNCLNRPSWGGYLLYRLFPNIRVSFDGRITTLGADVYRDHVEFFNGKRNQEIANRYQFDFAIMLPAVFGYGKPIDDINYRAPDLSNDWLEVWRDEHPEREGSAVVALRKSSPRFEENLKKVRVVKR
ncbi:MAG: hypothetical protein HY286_07510 [Planctomycetes bacterium]|nr:hypothetical protein [Planctomycetota bacterium]